MPRRRCLRRPVHGQHDEHGDGAHRALAGRPQRDPGRGPGEGRGGAALRRAGDGPRHARRPAVGDRRAGAPSRTASPRWPRPAARRTASCTSSRSPARRASPLEIDDFSRIADATPIVADLKPGGRFSAAELYDAGGVALVMRELLKRDLLHGDAPTVDGRTIAEVAAGAPSRRRGRTWSSRSRRPSRRAAA